MRISVRGEQPHREGEEEHALARTKRRAEFKSILANAKSSILLLRVRVLTKWSKWPMGWTRRASNTMRPLTHNVALAFFGRGNNLAQFANAIKLFIRIDSLAP